MPMKPAKKRGAKKPISMPVATRKKRAPRKNPVSYRENQVTSKIWQTVGGNGLVHAVGGYAGTRLGGRLLRSILGSKFPALGRHGGPLGNLLMAVAVYFASQKWKKIREEAMIGSAVAVFQSLLQTYIPGLAWLIDAGGEAPAQLAAPKATSGVENYRRRRERFVSPGEVESEEPGVRYVAPGEPGSGYGAPAGGQPRMPTAQAQGEYTEKDFDAGIDDLGDGGGDADMDGLGIFEQ